MMKRDEPIGTRSSATSPDSGTPSDAHSGAGGVYLALMKFVQHLARVAAQTDWERRRRQDDAKGEADGEANSDDRG